MAESKYSLEQYLFFSDCNDIGMTPQETLDAFEEDYEQIGILTKRAVELIRYRTDKWIYMLKDVMTAEEALEDYYNHIIEHPEINWKDNPKYIKSVVDTIGDSIREAMYKFFTQHEVKITQRILSRQRSRALAAGKIKKGDAGPQSFFLPYKITDDKIHPDIYVTHGNDSVFNAEVPVSVTCYALGHETIKDSVVKVYYTGCGECHKLNFTFNKHPDPLAPGIFYWGPLLDSTLNDLKLGNTLERVGVKRRSKKYGKFKWKEIHKPIGEVEKFEREMKVKYELYRTNNPMLEGNGSTETFSLIILPDLEKDIKEWIK